MANKIVLKKSSVAAKVPTAGDLDYGELAINYQDGKIYYKKADNSIDAFLSSTASIAGVSSFNTRTGAITLNSSDVTSALGYTPLSAAGGTITGDIAATMNQAVHGLSILPSGYVESNPVNFRFDTDVLRYINRKPGVTITTSGFNSSEVDILFSQFSSFVNLNGKPDGSFIQVEGFAFNNSANGNWWPFVFTHAGSYSLCNVTMEVKTTGSIDWQVLYTGPFNSYKVATVPSISGAITGARWTFSGQSTVNTYIRYLGVIGRNSDAFAWNIMKGGDTMYGDLNFSTGYTAKINGNNVIHTGNYNLFSLPLTGGTLVGPLISSSTISHTGLVPTDGIGIDQIKSLTKAITLTTDWQDTGISGTDLATGTYVVQLYANDAGAGGYNSNEYYSGTMSWYSGTTQTSAELPTDEIPLHRAGASSDAGLYLRTYRTNNGALKLQIYSNYANASSSNYVFKFRRLI